MSSPLLYSFLQAFTLLYSFLQGASHPYTASYKAGRSDNTEIHIPCHTQPAFTERCQSSVKKKCPCFILLCFLSPLFRGIAAVTQNVTQNVQNSSSEFEGFCCRCRLFCCQIKAANCPKLSNLTITICL